VSISTESTALKLANIDKRALLERVQRILPKALAIGLTGSAAFDAKHLGPHSDIDIIAVNPRNCHIWNRFGGRELEIEGIPLERIKTSVRNPQWHGPNYIWNIGKIAGAEQLYGLSLSKLVTTEITARTQLIAGAGLIGFLLFGQEKARLGRRPASLDIPLALTALRRLVAGELPIRAEADEDLAKSSFLSDFSMELEKAKVVGANALDILKNNDEVSQICYMPAHRVGLAWFRKSLNIDLEMPRVCFHA
jgi:hypothetical protein